MDDDGMLDGHDNENDNNIDDNDNDCNDNSFDDNNDNNGDDDSLMQWSVLLSRYVTQWQ